VCVVTLPTGAVGSKLLGAGDAAYLLRRVRWNSTVRGKSDIYYSLIYS